MARTIAVWKSDCERGYHVGTQGKRSTKLFLWGDFDEGSISWQAARKMAFDYARKEAARIGGEVIKL